MSFVSIFFNMEGIGEIGEIIFKINNCIIYLYICLQIYNNIFKQINQKIVLYKEKKVKDNTNHLFVLSFPIIMNYIELDLSDINNLRIVCKNIKGSSVKHLYISNIHLHNFFNKFSDNTKCIQKRIHLINIFINHHTKNNNLYYYIVNHINNNFYNIIHLYIDLNSIIIYLLKYNFYMEYESILSTTYNNIFDNLTYLKLNNLQSLTIHFMNNKFIHDIYILKNFPYLKYLDYPLYNIYFIPFIKNNYPNLKTLKIPQAIYDYVENNITYNETHKHRLIKWQKKIFTDSNSIIKHLDEIKLDITIFYKFSMVFPINQLKKISITNNTHPILLMPELLESIMNKIIQKSPKLKYISLHFNIFNKVKIKIRKICNDNNIHLNFK